jgi:hypothetical protein
VGFVLYLQLVSTQRLARFKDGARLWIIYFHRIPDERSTRIPRRSCSADSAEIRPPRMTFSLQVHGGKSSRALNRNSLGPTSNQPSAGVHNSPPPHHLAPLRIHQELVDEGRDVKDAAVSEVINGELERLNKCHKEVPDALHEER